jgi:hypothetical protein
MMSARPRSEDHGGERAMRHSYLFTASATIFSHTLANDCRAEYGSAASGLR